MTILQKALESKSGVPKNSNPSDNKIDKREEDLIKEYFIACGLPKDMYEIVLNKLKDNTIYPGDLRIR